MSVGELPGWKSATFSSATLPSRDEGTVRPAMAACVVRSSARAQMHFVLLATFVVGGDLIAADEQAQRVCRVANLHAEIGGLWTIDVHRELRFPRVERRVDVHHAGQRLHTFDEVTADGLELLQI